MFRVADAPMPGPSARQAHGRVVEEPGNARGAEPAGRVGVHLAALAAETAARAAEREAQQPAGPLGLARP